MKRLFALAILTLLISGQLFINNSAYAGTSLAYANSFTHHSSLLKEDRQYSIMLPPSYQRNSSQHYPVVYLLDGESKMLHVGFFIITTYLLTYLLTYYIRVDLILTHPLYAGL